MDKGNSGCIWCDGCTWAKEKTTGLSWRDTSWQRRASSDAIGWVEWVSCWIDGEEESLWLESRGERECFG